jgi:YggT family protein
VAEIVLQILRGAVALCCGAAGVVALTHWLVRQGTLAPFGAWPRLVRNASDPVIKPVERYVVSRGGNPQLAPYWLLAACAIGGLVLLSVARWVIGVSYQLGYAGRGGVRGVLAFAVAWTCDLLTLALLVRVIGSWFGIGRYTPWMRPFHSATDWMLRPLQRMIPPIGMIDVTPLVACVILALLKPFLVGLIR